MDVPLPEDEDEDFVVPEPTTAAEEVHPHAE